MTDRQTRDSEPKARALSRLAAIVKDSQDAILAKTLDGIITDWNPSAERLFGFAASEMIGQSVARLFPPDRTGEHEKIMALIRDGKSIEHFDTVRLRKDGVPIDVSVTVSPLRDETDAVVGASTIARDITERKRVERELERLNADLEARVVARTVALVDANQKLQVEIAERKHAEETLQESYGLVRALAGRIDAVREEERARIARELHDELGQALTALKFDLAALKQEFSRRNKRLRDKANEISLQIDATIKMVRRIATELRPGILDDLGLAAAVEWQAQEFQARTNIMCEMDLPEEIEIGDAAATALFRIFQETLTNVARHAQATRVRIQMTIDESAVQLDVQDDGRGIALSDMRGKRSLGLLGMRERAELLGGSFKIHGASEGGTRVTIRLPLKTPESQ